MQIGDIWIALRAEGAEFVKEAQKEGAKAGDAAGKSFGDRLKANAGKIVGAALAAGFAVATKGALEAEAAQGKFMAATGKSREEAKDFVSTMNDLAGTSGAVGKTFEEIADVGTTVEQQFKTTGEQTRELTDDILKFSKVTGQDAAGAAAQLEDTLSAFGLEAEDAAGLMDQLVASNQEFGTDAGPETLSVLQSMAPALQAMGAEIDDGIGLLNLFETAGLDAGAAQAGLKKAIANLKPGETLDDLIAQIGAIEDPTLRAQAAIDIFGAKAGPGLALAIRPGMTSLDDFEIAAGDVAGTVETASEDMLTLSDRIKGWADKALAGAREIGNQFGPLVTGAASVASLAGPLIKSFGGLKGFGPLTTAIKGAGKAGGLIYLGAVTVAETFANALSGMWTKVKTNPRVIAGAEGAGRAMGSTVGKFLIIGAAVALLAQLPEMWDQLKAKWKEVTAQAEQIPTATAAFLGNPATTRAQVEAQLAELRKLPDQLDPIKKAIFELGRGGLGLPDAKGVWLAQIAAMEAYLRDEAGPGIAGAFEVGITSSGSWGKAGGIAATGFGATFGPAIGIVVAEGWQGAIDAAKAKIAQMHRDAAWGGAQTPREFSQGTRSAFDTVRDAFGALRQLMRDTLSPAKKEAELEGIATSRLLARGLRSGKPEVRGEAQQIALDTIAELHKLNPASTKIGDLTTLLLARALPHEKPALQDAINAIMGVVKTPLSTLPTAAGNTGDQITSRLAARINAGRPTVIAAIDRLASGVMNHLRVGSPAKEGPWSKDGGPLAWMERLGLGIPRELADAMRAGIPGLRLAAAAVAGAGVPALAGLTAPGWQGLPATASPVARLATAGAAGMPFGGGGDTINLTQNLQFHGLPIRAETPAEVARQVARLSTLGELPKRRR